MFGAEAAVLHNGFSIRHERREVIGSMTRLYTSEDGNSSFIDVNTADIDHVEPDLSPEPFKAAVQPLTPAPQPKAPTLLEVITAAGGRHKLDPDLIGSVIRAESNFNNRARSPKGAQGLMQLMPTTASTLGVKNAFDPGDNVEAGTRYLRQLLERYDFDLGKALAAYNAGPDRVQRYHGVPPYHETRAYVSQIIRDFNRKKLAERKASKTESSAATKSVIRAAAKAPAPSRNNEIAD